MAEPARQLETNQTNTSLNGAANDNTFPTNQHVKVMMKNPIETAANENRKPSGIKITANTPSPAAVKPIKTNFTKIGAGTEKTYTSSKMIRRPRILKSLASGQKFNRRYTTAANRPEAPSKKKESKLNPIVFAQRRIIQTAMWQHVTWVWLFQIILFAVMIIGFSVYSVVDGSWAAKAALWAASWVPGETGDNAEALSNIGIGIVLLPWGISALFSEAIFLGTAFILSGFGIKILNSSGKHTLFLVSFIGYALPFFQIFPWALLWLYALYRNPR